MSDDRDSPAPATPPGDEVEAAVEASVRADAVSAAFVLSDSGSAAE